MANRSKKIKEIKKSLKATIEKEVHDPIMVEETSRQTNVNSGAWRSAAVLQDQRVRHAFNQSNIQRAGPYST